MITAVNQWEGSFSPLWAQRVLQTAACSYGSTIALPRSAVDTSDTSDDDLMLRYADGDIAAFDLLYARYRTRLFRYLNRLVSNRAQAEELYQDTWSRVIDARTRYAPTARFGAWLFRIAHHLAIDHLRRSRPQVDVDEVLLSFPGPSGDDPSISFDQAERCEHLLRLVDGLPTEQKAVLLLRAEGELSLEEIAQNMNTGRETIKSRLRYALAKLRQGLQKP